MPVYAKMLLGAVAGTAMKAPKPKKSGVSVRATPEMSSTQANPTNPTNQTDQTDPTDPVTAPVSP